MTTGHNGGITGTELLGDDGAHVVLELGQFEELAGDEEGDFRGCRSRSTDGNRDGSD
jgi:hypothetical protein